MTDYGPFPEDVNDFIHIVMNNYEDIASYSQFGQAFYAKFSQHLNAYEKLMMSGKFWDDGRFDMVFVRGLQIAQFVYDRKSGKITFLGDRHV